MGEVSSKTIGFLLALLILAIAILEIRRGWKILVRKQVAFFTGIPLLLIIINFFELEGIARKIEDNLSKEDSLKVSGILGFVLGILLFITSIGSILGF
jgi:hypothetical protein